MAYITPDICLVSQIPSILPEAYEAAPDHTKSNNTRKPGAYDLHLDESLQLRKVLLSKDLPEALQRLYDKEINSTLLATPLARFGMTADNLFDAVDMRKPIKNESGIRKDYYQRTAQFCIPLASAILHHRYAKTLGKSASIGDQFIPLFVIDDTETTKEPALPDLCINPNLKAKIHPDIKKKIDVDISLLKKHFLTNICFLEVKSLVAATEDAMAAIVELGTEGINNEWMKCEVAYLGQRVLCDCKGVAESRKKHTKKDGQQKKTGRRMGPDSAVQSCWWTNDSVKTGCGGQLSLANTHHHQSSVWTRKATDEARLKARYIVQQVWSELVAIDGTFGIISSGNHEIVARRDRESQTLYISDVITPSVDKNPSHYILHAALYVASWLDAVDRAEQLDGMTEDNRTAITKAGHSLPSWWKRYEQGIYDGDKLAYSADMALPTVKKAEQEREQEVACQKLSDLLSIAKEIYVDIPSPNTSQQKFKAATFSRLPVSLDDNPCNATPRIAAQKDDVKDVVGRAQSTPTRKESPTLSFPRKLSEAVYRVTVTAVGYSSDFFVMKMARNATDQAKLLAECKEYLQMETLRSDFQKSLPSGSTSAPPITVRLFGMFTCSLGQGGNYKILVLAHGGIPAEQPLEASQSKNYRHVQKFNEVSKQTELTLAVYHNQYKRVHNRLSTAHVMYNPADKEVRLISLGHATSIAEFEQHTKAKRNRIRQDRVQLVMDGLIEELVEPEKLEAQASDQPTVIGKRRARL